jgi:uncharacterized BrkB/YihY/UPF0761 family membrane protein
MAKHEIKWGKAIMAGFLGTLAMAVAGISVAPRMGMEPMNTPEMLSGPMGGSMGLAWASLFIIGIVLALIYAAVQRFLPGPSAIRGALFAIIVWVLIQIGLMPLIGQPFFMGSLPMATMSFINALIYGLILGAIYGESSRK